MKKRCSKCGDEKELIPKNWFRNKSHKNGFDRWCKLCASKFRHNWNRNNRDKCRQWHHTCESKRPDHYKKVRQDWAKEDVAKLSDRYILNLLTGFHPRKSVVFNRQDITPEMIGLKREQIMLSRELTKLKRAVNEFD